ncbi:cyclopropane-fatty-acyl-phospholipid synthase [Streptomyces laurentii]|uniref:Cyclopropane-fatty-acyl-phospholipid synthase n=1 Tax=Streptomyces laurentii TaxID=39478 RepID=A0A160NZ31_STRLU|nr:cyclopropane-fatty-acyl-phospholipid synthase [Streptomyces laurentii]
MARIEDGKAYGYGKLHAAFRMMEALAVGKGELAEPSPRKATINQPRREVVALLRDTSEYILLAREKGGDRAKAAAQLYAEIAELIAPEPMYAKNPTADEKAAFEQGYEDQMARYRDRWGGLASV